MIVAVLTVFLLAHQVKSRTEQHLYEETMRGVDAGRSVNITDRKVIGALLENVVMAQQYSSSTLSSWLEILADKESGNRADIRVLDTNGKYSYGCLQFQMETWLGFGKAGEYLQLSASEAGCVPDDF